MLQYITNKNFGYMREKHVTMINLSTISISEVASGKTTITSACTGGKLLPFQRHVYLLVLPLHLHKLILHLQLSLLHLYQLLIFGLHLLLLSGDLQQRLYLRDEEKDSKHLFKLMLF